MNQELKSILIVFTATLAALVFHHLAEKAEATAGEIRFPSRSIESSTAFDRLPAGD